MGQPSAYTIRDTIMVKIMKYKFYAHVNTLGYHNFHRDEHRK